MNYSIIIYIIGWILKIESILFLLPMITSIIYRESNTPIYLGLAAVTYLVGFALSFKKPKKKTFYMKEGFAVVALSWLVISAVGAIPFVLTGDIPNYTDALFETISGFTTTGASILNDVEALSHSALLWRSFTHWVGGMGVVVFMLALLPLLGGSSMSLLKAESPGPSVDKLVPKMKDTAKILYMIYIFITVAEFIILLIAKMPVFDAICISVGTTGTGGFGVRNDSLGGYSPLIQNIVTFFMIASGINYVVYFYILQRKFKQILKLEETKWYLGIIFVAIVLITLNIYPIYHNIGTTIRHAAFQVGSVITTTGFSTADFNQWPEFSKIILVCLMFIGACAGSTGGGIKVSRILIFLKIVNKELSKLIHPRAVSKIKLDNHTVAEDNLYTSFAYLAAYCFIFFFSFLFISLDGMNLTTNFTAVAATLNNIGPGLDAVGPAANFAQYGALSKYILMFDMLAGRLEIFPMLVLFFPGTWRRKI